MEKITCLGIESTAHTFGVAVIDEDGNVLSNEKDSYISEEGGMIPNEVSDHHVYICDVVLKKALKTAGLSMSDINLVSFSQGPGLGNSLIIGAFFARAICLKNNIPIIGVNHCLAHLEIGNLLTDSTDPVMLYASGANTQVIAYDGGKFRIFGESLDIGVGNLLDVFARHIGLGFPGGPAIQKLAESGKELIELPYSVKGMDVSFGGILTNVKQKFDSGKYIKENLCFSLQEHVFAMLVEIAERAMAHCDKNELILGGGVACNARLKEMCQKMCEERGAKCYVPPNQYLVDNAAMIAWQGILEYNAGKRQSVSDTKILPYWRTDDVEVNWRE